MRERNNLETKPGQRGGGGGKRGESGESAEINFMLWAGAMELLPRGLLFGNTKNVLNVAHSVPKCNFGTENALMNKSGENYRQFVVKKWRKWRN